LDWRVILMLDEPNDLGWWVYIIETKCKKLYTGITTDVARRFQEHLAVHRKESDKGAKFFRGHEPNRVVYQEAYGSRSVASKREYEIKKMSALKKRSLIT